MAKSRVWIAFLLMELAGCKRHPHEPEAFALAFVEAGRSGTLGADWVDDALIERVRRAERLKLAVRAGAPAEALAKVWGLPDAPGIAPEARADKQRERAAAGLSRALQGECHALPDEEGTKKRVTALTESVETAPTDANVELAALATALATAHVTRIQCAHGAVGLLLVPHAPDWRVVDIFALGENKSPVPLPPVK